MNLKSEQVNQFARRAFARLSDSITEQKSDLEVLVEILPKNSDSRKAAMEMLTALNLRDQAQREFIFGGTK